MLRRNVAFKFELCARYKSPPTLMLPVSTQRLGATARRLSSNFKIEINDNNLTVSGERKFTNEKKDKNFHSVETNYGSFSRSFTLPDNSDGSKISAKYNNGILELVIPKDENRGKQNAADHRAPDAVAEGNEAAEQGGDKGEYAHQNNEGPIHGCPIDRHSKAPGHAGLSDRRRAV